MKMKSMLNCKVQLAFGYAILTLLAVVDSPTLLNMADSRILASYVDGVVLIVTSRATPKALAKQACANVRGAGATIIGVVLNQLEIGDSQYSYSYYGYPKKTGSLDR